MHIYKYLSVATKIIQYCVFLCFQMVMAIGTNLAKYLHYDQNLPLTKIQRSSITMKWFCWKLQKKDFFQVVVVFWSPSYVWLFVTPGTAAYQVSLSFTVSWNLLQLRSIELMVPSNHLIRCHPFFLLSFIFPSIRVFCKESALLIRWPNIGASASSSVFPVNIQG